MTYSEKFQQLADDASSSVEEVAPSEVDVLMAAGAIALDIRDKEEHDADHISGSLHVSRGKLEMNIESAIPDLDTTILCYCNAYMSAVWPTKICWRADRRTLLRGTSPETIPPC